MSIHFEKIRWRNFLSTGAPFTEVVLDKSPTTLIIGENGAGKSTILDALCFALFGKPFRNINKPQLVNTINLKNLLVEVEFSIGTKKYQISRGIKPTVFEIRLNGELLNQDAASRDYQKYLEEHVLKLNYKSFTQIVILGSASFTPFMQLPAAHRREVIEDLLDIKIFSVMNDVLKQKNADIKTQIQELENKVEVGKTKIQLQQDYIKTLEGDKQKKVEDVQGRIDQATKKLLQLNDDSAREKAKLLDLKSSIQDAETVKAKYSKLGQLLQQLSDRIKAQEEGILFYDEHDVCPTCSQSLDSAIKKKAKTGHSHKIKELERAIAELKDQQSTLSKKLDDITAIEEKISECKDRIIAIDTNIIAEQNYQQKLQQEINQYTTESGNITEEKQKLKALAKEIVKISESKATLVEEKHYLDVAGILLKDTGIKTRIIKQYLPVINKLVNKYLQAMDMFVVFELDESFTESIKSRHRDDFSYASFSEGEKARIDLALLFAWRTIAKMKNSASTNLLLLDEVFDGSLDVHGTDFVMTILNTMDSETNTFIISHKDALFDKFKSVIKFEKKNNFSVIAK